MKRSALGVAWGVRSRESAILCAGIVPFVLAGCGFNPSRPFDRDAPAVRQAITALDAGDAAAAVSALEEYLSTGPCKDGAIGTPESLKRRADGTFDLGLALFRLGEQFGRRFGDEEAPNSDENVHARRHEQIECARRLVQAIGNDDAARTELRARARYLEGNLAFLDGEYQDAVRAYDGALELEPGQVDAGDSVGRDAAYNRAIALRRIEDEKDGGNDAAHDGAADGASGDSGHEGDSGPSGPKDAGRDGASAQPDAGDDRGDEAGPPPEPPDAEPPRDAGVSPPSTRNEDERMLDQLESAPTLQQEEAKRFGRKRVRGKEDK